VKVPLEILEFAELPDIFGEKESALSWEPSNPKADTTVVPSSKARKVD